MPILVTVEVLKPDASRDVSDEQPTNILLILVTLDVTNPDTSSDVSDEQL